MWTDQYVSESPDQHAFEAVARHLQDAAGWGVGDWWYPRGSKYLVGGDHPGGDLEWQYSASWKKSEIGDETWCKGNGPDQANTTYGDNIRSLSFLFEASNAKMLAPELYGEAQHVYTNDVGGFLPRMLRMGLRFLEFAEPAVRIRLTVENRTVRARLRFVGCDTVDPASTKPERDGRPAKKHVLWLFCHPFVADE